MAETPINPDSGDASSRQAKAGPKPVEKAVKAWDAPVAAASEPAAEPATFKPAAPSPTLGEDLAKEAAPEPDPPAAATASAVKVGLQSFESLANEAAPEPEPLAAATETAKSAMDGLKVGLQSFEGLAQGWARALGAPGPSGKMAEVSLHRLEAASRASGMLAKGMQDASKVWMELARQTAKSNLEAMVHLAQARSLPELVAAQGGYVCESLDHAIAGGEEIAKISSTAIREAALTMQSQGASET